MLRLTSGFILFSLSMAYVPINYTNPADHYSPSLEIKAGSNICTTDIHDPAYRTDVLKIPIGLFIIGVVAMLLMDMGLCCGCTKSCALTKEGTLRSVTIPLIVTYILLVACFVSTHILYLGYNEMTLGFGNVIDGINKIENMFLDLNATADVMGSNAARMVVLCSQYACSESTEIADMSVQVGYGGNLLTLITTITDLTSSSSSLLHGYLDAYVVPAMFVMYALLVVAVLTYLFSIMCHQKGWLSGSVGHICWFLVTICGIVWMILVSAVADFCTENPTVNAIESFQFGGDDRAFIQWYSTCRDGRAINVTTTGEINYYHENPMDEFLNPVSVLFANFLQQTNSSSGSANYTELRAIATDQLALVDSSRQIMYCPAIQAAWFGIVNDGVCGNIFDGVRNVWIAEISSCILLFFIIFFASIVSRHYHPHTGAVMPSEADVEAPVGDAAGGHHVELMERQIQEGKHI